MGSLLFLWRGEGPEGATGERKVDLKGAAPQLPRWWAAGGGLALQALVPYVSQPGRDLALHTLLAAGPGAALPALAARFLGFGSVDLASTESDRGAFLAASEARKGDGGTIHTRGALDEAPRKPGFHLAMLGCGGALPPLALCAGLAERVRAEGLMVIFGVPRGALGPFFHDLAGQGFSLRGCGFHGDLAFLCGSPLPTRIPVVR